MKPYPATDAATAKNPAIAAEKYRRLREKIVSAGIPLLTDKELRREIRERKGSLRSTTV